MPEITICHPAFLPIAPDQDIYLERYFVAPSIYDTVLDGRSTLVCGERARGKSTLAHVARQVTQGRWLNVDFPAEAGDSLYETLLESITQEIWNRLEQTPHLLGTLGSRQVALHYFLSRYLDLDLGFLLSRLADDNPHCAEAIHQFRQQPLVELFRPHAGAALRLETICDCVTALGFESAVVWIDIPGQTSPAQHPELKDLFDTVSLMRKRRLHFKCFAPPALCHELASLRSAVTLSVDLRRLDWEPEGLHRIVDARLGVLSAGQTQPVNSSNRLPCTLNEVSAALGWSVAGMASFLAQYSDVASPAEWLALTGCALAALEDERLDSPQKRLLRTQRSYFAARLKLRMDAEGVFWRGPRHIEDLTQRKRIIYKLVRYLYEHPGFHSTYQLAGVLNIDNLNVNTSVYRARNFLEPHLDDSEHMDEVAIYLVTDASNAGYALKNTERG